MGKQKIAFVHCWILPGGALKVLENLIKNEKSTSFLKIFTLFSDRKNLFVGEQKIEIITVLPKFINNIFLYCYKNNIYLLSKIFDYRNLIFFYPLLMKNLSRKIKKYKPENIVISSFAVSKNINYCKKNSKLKVKNIKLYLHSPMQYIWSHYDEYLEKMNGIKKIIYKILVFWLRKRDKKFIKYDQVYVNSKYTSKITKKIYGLDSKVSYPNIDKEFLDIKVNKNPDNYYLYIGRITKLVKDLDKIIKLFNFTGENLLILGDGSDYNELKKKAGKNIIFLGWIDDIGEKIQIIKNAKALINITKESFGLSNLEGLYLGVPIFSYNGGANIELINDKSGILVPNKEEMILRKYFEIFKNKKFDREKIKSEIILKFIG